MTVRESATVRILGFAGSLRKGSYNRMLLKAAAEVAPQDVELEIFDIEGIPPFNQDLENEPHEKVREFKERVKAADAILMATPEYNYSVPGVLKNALDAASRPYGTNPFEGKPVAIMGASIGMLGTARAQYHLRQTLVFFNCFVLNRPEIMVPFSEQKFDTSGNLTDDRTRQLIQDLLAELAKWARKLNQAR
ncbi:MAG: NAD(P)H-dependent oxidoreductase [Syntrophorhabdaceae bacterium]|nr:NAD(P)H-dependent oxidoreductase [Syntrophorhabdaceae bacterium]